MYRVEVPAFPGPTIEAESVEAAVIAARLFIAGKIRSLIAAGSLVPSFNEYVTEFEVALARHNRLLHVVEVKTYRRPRDSDTWIFCQNCEAWPDVDYEERLDEPTDGEMCNECRALEARRSCHC